MKKTLIPIIILVHILCTPCYSFSAARASFKLFSPPGTATETTVTLLWDKAFDWRAGSLYFIYKDGKQVAQSTKANFTIEGLLPGQSYSFFICCKNNNNKTQAKSNTIAIRTPKKGRLFNVTDFGAVGDGTTKNTIPIQKAIDACTPGGIVYLAKGVYLCGALFLKSDMTLLVDSGAVLKGSTQAADYYPKYRNRFEGWELNTLASLLNAGSLDNKAAYAIENITIRGKGTISGGGEALSKNMIASEGMRGRGRLICLVKCRNVNIQGLTIEESPCWTIHYIYSNNVSCHDLTINSKVINGDGIDPDSSTDSYIFNCTFSNNDDCIAIKSGKNPEGYYLHKPTINVRITDCNFIAGHGISIGSEMSGGVKGVLVEDCIAGALLNGFQIKGTKERGGYVTDVRVRDCNLRKITIYTKLSYNNDGEAAPEVPLFKNISFKNISMLSGDIRQPLIDINGFDSISNFTKNVAFENITLPDKSLIKVTNCDNVVFRNVKTSGEHKANYQIVNSVHIKN